MSLTISSFYDIEYMKREASHGVGNYSIWLRLLFSLICAGQFSAVVGDLSY